MLFVNNYLSTVSNLQHPFNKWLGNTDFFRAITSCQIVDNPSLGLYNYGFTLDYLASICSLSRQVLLDNIS